MALPSTRREVEVQVKEKLAVTKGVTNILMRKRSKQGGKKTFKKTKHTNKQKNPHNKTKTNKQKNHKNKQTKNNSQEKPQKTNLPTMTKLKYSK